MSEETKDLRVYNVPKSTVEGLKRISKKIGIPTGVFVKMKLREIVNEHETNNKTPYC